MRNPTGASAELLPLAWQEKLSMSVSVALALDDEAVCLRAEYTELAGLTQKDALSFVDAVVAMADPVAFYYCWRPQLRDPSDEMVLEAAFNAKADALLTFNLRHFQPAALSFGLQIQRPGGFSRSLYERQPLVPCACRALQRPVSSA